MILWLLYVTNEAATSNITSLPPLPVQRKCEQYWADNIGEVFETQDKKMEITTTSSMPFADFEIRTFNAKNVSPSYNLVNAKFEEERVVSCLAAVLCGSCCVFSISGLGNCL